MANLILDRRASKLRCYCSSRRCAPAIDASADWVNLSLFWGFRFASWRLTDRSWSKYHVLPCHPCDTGDWLYKYSSKWIECCNGIYVLSLCDWGSFKWKKIIPRNVTLPEPLLEKHYVLIGSNIFFFIRTTVVSFIHYL